MDALGATTVKRLARVAARWAWQIVLTPPGVAVSTGYKGLAAVGEDVLLERAQVFCDPNNKPSAADIIINCYVVDPVSGTRTSIFQTAPTIAASTATMLKNTGVLAPSMRELSENTLLETRITQGSDGQGVYLHLIGTRRNI